MMLLLLPLKWCLAMAAASAIHELFHILFVRLFGYRINNIHIRFGGAVIETDIPDRRKELLCILAGPAGSLILVLFYRYVPEITVCALVQSAYNLLPFPNLDGGRAMGCILESVFHKNPLQR